MNPKLIIDGRVLSSAALTAETALAAFRRLDDSAQDLLQSGERAEDVFWSRYYWFSVFARLSESERGFDAGIQQNLLKLLEHPQPTCAPDWTLLEAVERQARQETDRWSSSS
ncbi:hypothetical protein GNX71_22110 [Variovorax sp. RKNM96]|uniref:hypothetical protein n=1 Tax=Variovorax sp. RKNM96 TaxID=2681552 RepID=UPI001981C721|nr:hypothetical protein [Variovorax sp. RKNM96]QSI32127.1 hypothetical protein GNX71_22110 [Variovorax sp. RKNM96]